MTEEPQVVQIEKCGCCVVAITTIPEGVVVQVIDYDSLDREIKQFSSADIVDEELVV